MSLMYRVYVSRWEFNEFGEVSDPISNYLINEAFNVPQFAISNYFGDGNPPRRDHVVSLLRQERGATTSDGRTIEWFKRNGPKQPMLRPLDLRYRLTGKERGRYKRCLASAGVPRGIVSEAETFLDVINLVLAWLGPDLELIPPPLNQPAAFR